MKGIVPVPFEFSRRGFGHTTGMRGNRSDPSRSALTERVKEHNMNNHEEIAE
jgi:hypothetical protein